MDLRKHCSSLKEENQWTQIWRSFQICLYLCSRTGVASVQPEFLSLKGLKLFCLQQVQGIPIHPQPALSLGNSTLCAASQGALGALESRLDPRSPCGGEDWLWLSHTLQRHNLEAGIECAVEDKRTGYARGVGHTFCCCTSRQRYKRAQGAHLA